MKRTASKHWCGSGDEKSSTALGEFSTFSRAEALMVVPKGMFPSPEEPKWLMVPMVMRS